MRRQDVPALLRVYHYGLIAGEPALAGLLAWRRRRGKEDPVRLPERTGRPSKPRPAGPLVWAHGASIGEALSLIGLVERLTRRGFTVLVTSGTRTSAALLARRLPRGALHQFAPSMRRATLPASSTIGGRTWRSSPNRNCGRTPSWPCTSARCR